MKACSRCKEIKPPESFHRSKEASTGLAPACKTCASKRAALSYAVNRASEAQRAKRYRAANLTRLKANVNAYKAANAAAISAARRAHKIEHPDLNRQSQQARKARLLRATPAWADKAKIRAIYRECVMVERATGTPHHVDHFYPLVSAEVCGLHCEANLRIVPATVNVRKGNRLVESHVAEHLDACRELAA